jgi:hypothetical protein
LTTTEGLTSASGDRFAGALAFARANRLDRACEMWEEIARSDRNSVATHHNLGVCSEAQGDLDTALNRYALADRQLTKPDPTVSESLARVRGLLENRARLRTQTPAR